MSEPADTARIGILDDRQDVHVLPEFGREHTVDRACWCKPRRDNAQPRVWIHTPREVA